MLFPSGHLGRGPRRSGVRRRRPLLWQLPLLLLSVAALAALLWPVLEEKLAGR